MIVLPVSILRPMKMIETNIEINCQGVSARMMELLYGELSSDERATIEAHVAVMKG